MLQPLVRGTMFQNRIRHYYRATSTNTMALEAALAGAPEGTVFLAEHQTVGRGRGNHAWHSPQLAGIYCSVLLRPSLPPAEVLVLSLVTGLALQSAVEQIDRHVLVDLKWPNDLLIHGRKFAGILTEMSAEATAVRHIVVGIGINVNQTDFPDELRQTATSLRLATGTEWSRLELCAALLKSLEREYQNLVANRGAPAEVLRRFEERSSSVRGRRVVIEDNGGVEGTTEGLDPRGFLQVSTREGRRIVYSGPVKLI
jgi:BirA family biotin operon repressor/biotin-[acetyl-CoA-carboxylase] ligase